MPETRLPAARKTLREIRDTAGVLGPRDGKPRHERRFRHVVRALVQNGHLPTPSNIRYCIFRAANPTGQSRPGTGGPMLAGREVGWRRDELLKLGWSKDLDTGRWRPKGGTA